MGLEWISMGDTVGEGGREKITLLMILYQWGGGVEKRTPTANCLSYSYCTVCRKNIDGTSFRLSLLYCFSNLENTTTT